MKRPSRRGRSWLIAALIAAPGAALSAEAAPAGEFRAGAALIDITPARLPIRTAGNLTLTLADKVHDPLHVRALVLDDGATRVGIAAVDSCMIDREALDEAKEDASRRTGIPVENLLIASTHTHSAPAVYGCHGNDPEPEYRAWMLPRIAEALVKAAAARAPARAAWGKRDLATFVHCRRWVMKPGTAIHPDPRFTGKDANQAQMNPGHGNANKVRQTGPVDPAVTVLSVQTRDGKPLALLACYSTHYAGAPGVSADYFGEFCRLAAKALGVEEGKPFVALMMNGTSGDANAIDFTKPDWRADRFLVAQTVAEAALAAVRDAPYHADVPLGAVERRLGFGVRLPTGDEVGAARRYLRERVGDRPTRDWEENYARETVLLADWPARKELKLQALRIGGLGIGAIPCETFGSTGLAIKAASPFPVTMVIGLANGYSGYLPPPDQHQLGGYDTWRARTSYLETGAEPRVQEALKEMLRQAQAGK